MADGNRPNAANTAETGETGETGETLNGPGSSVAAWVADPTPWGETVRYGPAVADETKLKLLGQLSGKRLLLLGCGRGQVVIETARRGAKVIGFEPDEALLAEARAHCRDAGLPAELYQRDLAELASIRADTVDLVLSVLQLAGVADLMRVFRQAHRVLRAEAPLVLSLPHPVRTQAAGGRFPLPWSGHGHHGIDHGHGIESVFTALIRTGFRVDNLMELHDGADSLPAVLLLRARRTGARPTTT
ncbi:MAG: class I SAM-dependent methyltransferase [Acidimicrobiales bacterium]